MTADLPVDLPIDLPIDLPGDLPGDLPVEFSTPQLPRTTSDVPIARIAKVMLDKGIACARQKEMKEAIALFNQVLRLPVEDPVFALKSFYHRGCALSSVGLYAEAIADFTKVLEFSAATNTTVAVPAAKLTELYIHRGNAHRHLGQYPQAALDLDEGVERSGGSAQSYGCRGLLRLDRENFGGAIADFTQALTVHPTFSQCHLWRGFARLRSQDYALAIADLTRAIAVIPSCAEAYNHRGIAHFYRNHFALALTDFDQAIQLNAQFAEAYNNRGNLRQLTGDDIGATADHNKAAALNLPIPEPAQPSAAFYRDRAYTHFRSDRFSNAVSDYTRAIGISPSARAYYYRGKSCLALGALKQALLDFDAATVLSPDYGDVYADRAQLHFKLQSATESLSDIEQAITLLPPDSSQLRALYTTRCLAHFHVGRPAQALQDFEQLIALFQSSSHTSKASTSIGSSGD